MSIIGIVLIISGFGVLYIENLVYTFDSPEKAYSYEFNYEIIKIVEGEKTVLVASDEQYQIYVMDGDRYKFPNKCMIDNETYWGKAFTITIIKYNGTGEAYIRIIADYNQELTISDNKNSEFISYYESLSVENLNQTSYFSYIGEIDEGYTLIIDGKEFKLSDYFKDEIMQLTL